MKIMIEDPELDQCISRLENSTSNNPNKNYRFIIKRSLENFALYMLKTMNLRVMVCTNSWDAIIDCINKKKP